METLIEKMKKEFDSFKAWAVELFKTKNIIAAFFIVAVVSAAILGIIGLLLAAAAGALYILFWIALYLLGFGGIVFVGVFGAAFVFALAVLFHLFWKNLPVVENAFYASFIYREHLRPYFDKKRGTTIDAK